MRVLVVGASGQVGAALSRQLRAAGHAVVGTHHTVAAPETVPLSITDHDATARVIDLADSVFFPAAFSWVDGCENDPARAFAVNRDAPAAAARVAARRQAPFVFYSSEYVFDGSAEPYGEGDPVRPLSVYGQSKLEGERAVQAAHPGALVLRTSVVYGLDRQEKNFVYQVLRRGRAGERMKVPADQRSCPTYVEDLAASSLALVARLERGVFHVTGPEIAGRYGFARAICKAFGLDPAFLEPVTTASLGQKAARPLFGGLSTDRVKRLGITLRGPAAGLAAMREALEAARG